MEIVTRGQIVGALACQKNSYLRSLEAEVVSCIKRVSDPVQKSSKKKTQAATKGSEDSWLIEFSDSVLFPEGGGQPSDHGTIIPLSGSEEEPIPIRDVQRDGLRCVVYSPKPLNVGDRLRQDVDFQRRMDLMEQHTGQHLLSAIMNTYDNLKTLGWGMGSGDDMNYVDLPRKPTPEEMEEIQARCNDAIAESLPITVDAEDKDAKMEKLPGDYDHEKGVVRVINIGSLDRNTCCGTHLQQTSHIRLIVLGATQSVHGKNCRLFFACGHRAVRLALGAAGASRAIGRLLSCSTEPETLVAATTRINDSLSEAKKREKKLLGEIADREAEQIKDVLQTHNSAWLHRSECELDFFTGIIGQIKDVVKEKKAVVVFASGEDRKAGSIVIVGQPTAVEALSSRAKEAVPGLKGGGKGEKWQGKVAEWPKGGIGLLRGIVESYEIS